jgi:hypothetical protein
MNGLSISSAFFKIHLSAFPVAAVPGCILIEYSRIPGEPEPFLLLEKP